MENEATKVLIIMGIMLIVGLIFGKVLGLAINPTACLSTAVGVATGVILGK